MTESGTPDDPVEGLLESVLARPAREQHAYLDELVAQHPGHESELRGRYRELELMGMAGPTPLGPTLGPGVTLGRYRLVEELGHGAMGVVYRAQQIDLGDREVALKLLRPGILDLDQAKERFAREIEAVSKLDHPGICALYEAGEVGGVPFLAMRHVPGCTLAEHLTDLQQQGCEPPVSEMVALVAQAADALAVAHRQRLVHRDVKPGNIQLGEDGRPVLLDFGLARAMEGDQPTLTRTGDVVGTPAYMAPEQIDGRHSVSPATDVHALGVVLYECLTLRVPFFGRTRESLYHQILTATPARATTWNQRIPAELEVALEVALDKDPARRYATAEALATDLRRVLRKEPIAARRVPQWLRARRWCQRNPFAATAMAVLTAGLVAAFLLATSLQRSKRETEAANQAQEVWQMVKRDPAGALRFALNAVDRDRTPQTVAAVRGALYAPQPVFETAGLSRLYWPCFDVSPDGETMAWCNEDGYLHLWRNGIDQELRRIHEGRVHSLRFDPEGERFAVSGFRFARIFDLEGNQIAELDHYRSNPEDKGYVHSVAWHPSRNLLATGSVRGKDGKPAVHLWDLDSATDDLWCERVGSWPIHLRFLDSGEAFVVAPGSGIMSEVDDFEDHHVRAFDLAGKCIAHHDCHSRPCTEMDVSGSLVATVGHDGLLVLWDPTTGEAPVVRTHGQNDNMTSSDRIKTVDFAPDGGELVTAALEGEVSFYSRNGTLLREWNAVPGLMVQSAVYAPDGRSVIVDLNRNGRMLFDLEGRRLTELPGSTYGFRSNHFKANGDLVTLSLAEPMRVWRMRPASLRRWTWSGHVAARLGPTGRRVVLGQKDGSNVVVDLETGLEMKAIARGFAKVGWLDSRGWLYCPTNDRRIVVLDPNGSVAFESKPYAIPQQVVIPSPEGRWFVVADGAEFRLFESTDGRVEPRGILTPPRFMFLGLAWSGLAEESPEFLLAGTDGLYCWKGGEWPSPELISSGLVIPQDTYAGGMDVSSSRNRAVVTDGSVEVRIVVREGGKWREHHRFDLPSAVVWVSLAGEDRLLLVFGQTVWITDLYGNLLSLIESPRGVGFFQARLSSDGTKILTLYADFVLEEWLLEDEQILREARKLVSHR